jgi:hypothetical protein
MESKCPPEFTEKDAASLGRYMLDAIFSTGEARKYLDMEGDESFNDVPTCDLTDAYIRVWRDQQNEIAVLKATIERLEMQLRGHV